MLSWRLTLEAHHRGNTVWFHTNGTENFMVFYSKDDPLGLRGNFWKNFSICFHCERRQFDFVFKTLPSIVVYLLQCAQCHWLPGCCNVVYDTTLERNPKRQITRFSLILSFTYGRQVSYREKCKHVVSGPNYLVCVHACVCVCVCVTKTIDLPRSKGVLQTWKLVTDTCYHVFSISCV